MPIKVECALGNLAFEFEGEFLDRTKNRMWQTRVVCDFDFSPEDVTIQLIASNVEVLGVSPKGARGFKDDDTRARTPNSFSTSTEMVCFIT